MTEQEAFTKVRDHLLRQKEKCIVNGLCAYRGENGLKCAIGALISDEDLTVVKPVDWIMGSALLVSKEKAKIVGPFDEQFFMYMEDTDWCRRFWERGFKVVYYPDAMVYHYHAKGSARGGFFVSLLFNRLTWYHIESAFKYFWKYRKKPLPVTE